MTGRALLSLLLLTFIAGVPALARAGDSHWEVIRFYAVAKDRNVAIVVPAEWQELSGLRDSALPPALRFMDESGGEFEVPLAALARASRSKPVLGEQDLRRLALRSHQS